MHTINCSMVMSLQDCIQLKMPVVMQALGLSMPQFGHVSLILAPDRSKLSKRHGATSVGQVLLSPLV